ncbi:hypothetical protein H6G06_16900 [Anabaena sphaerica FACHB-251]|uniref:Uncharacterized protein n=1 Tax=Anabaena sphaerica FACHB-251 TaxID=2692883 RepID=A0A926WJ97_9NOST|nr:hypothetical protein [Anabaena sphaerica]MBD2295112.1 hypothetical protein [Anabaena sphaerica FACHB-251]
MKYALLTKIGGELIEASKADYQDYYGFLKCPVCNEPVFLRKGHLRNGKEIQASFAHHRAVPEISTCELRVGNYSKEDIEVFAAKARNQRLQKLNISMWKYMKTNISVNFSGYEQIRNRAKGNTTFGYLLDYGDECLLNNNDLIVDEFISVFSKMLRNQGDYITIIKERLGMLNQFLNDLTSDWELHEKITKEAAELFLSPPMKEIRYRVLTVLCYPDNMQLLNRDLVKLNMQTEAWQKLFSNYLNQQICLILLSVNWIKLLA